MERRYTALRVVGTLYKILGAIAAVLTIIALVGFCAITASGGALGGFANSFRTGGGEVLAGLIGAVFIILYGGGAAVTFYGLGELVYLLIALEENTRRTAQMLQPQVRPAQPAPPPIQSTSA